jgi:hypothetical protein
MDKNFKKLITEEVYNDIKGEMLESAGSTLKRMYITGPFLQAVERNRNGRVYPKPLIEREVDKFQSLIQSHESLGELNHPETQSVDPERACIRVTELIMDGNYAMGKALVLKTRLGKELQALIEDDCRLGVSSRGTGNLLEGNVVADDYNLICIDSVFLPSGQKCYSDPIYESVQRTTEWVLNESLGLYVEREIEGKTVDNANTMVNDIQVTSPQKAEEIIKATEKFNKTIDRKGSKEIRNAFQEWFKTL